MEPPRYAAMQSIRQDGPAPINLPARFLMPDRSEHECHAVEITPEGAFLLTSINMPPGVAIIVYIQDIGRIEATTSERSGGRLKIDFHLTGLRLERLATRLRWLAARNKLPPPDGRRHERFVPDQRHAHVTLPDGQKFPCEIIDISLSGAAIKTAVKPALGSQLLLGMTRGRVVRHFQNGIAIEFMQQLQQGQLGASMT